MSTASYQHPTLAGPRIVLRALTRNDVDRMKALANNYNLWKTLADGFPRPFTLADAYARIDASYEYYPLRTFAIALPSEGLIGWITLKAQPDIERTGSEIGYWIGEPYWGQGYAREAIGLITDYGFQVLKQSRIYGKVINTNPNSAKALLANGYTEDRTNRFAVLKEGKLYHQRVFSRLHPEIEAIENDGIDWPEPPL